MSEVGSQLELARRWLEATGDEVDSLEVDLPDGAKGPGLVVHHGSLKISIVLQRDILGVTVAFGVPAQARQKLAGLPPEARTRSMLAFRLELLSCPRAGFMYFPPDARDISVIERFVVIETVVVSEADPSSRNRLIDAVQEVANTGIRGLQVLGIASSGTAAGGGPAGSPPPPPQGIYG